MMAGKKNASKDTPRNSPLNNGYKNDRDNENAKAAAALEPEFPRISTENL
jgi:hypothetical protein